MVASWRDIQDAVSAWVCHGALFRFPELKIAVIENGATWLPPLLDTMADVYKKAPEGFAGDPVAAIKRSIYVSPLWEEDLAALADLIGVERVLSGSDYPHPRRTRPAGQVHRGDQAHAARPAAEDYERQPRSTVERVNPQGVNVPATLNI
jgi:hypothetical protein